MATHSISASTDIDECSSIAVSLFDQHYVSQTCQGVNVVQAVVQAMTMGSNSLMVDPNPTELVWVEALGASQRRSSTASAAPSAFHATSVGAPKYFNVRDPHAEIAQYIDDFLNEVWVKRRKDGVEASDARTFKSKVKQRVQQQKPKNPVPQNPLQK